MTLKQLRTGKWSGIVTNTLKAMNDDKVLEVFGKCQNEFELQNECWAYLGLGYKRTRKVYGLSLDPKVYEYWKEKAFESNIGVSTLINEKLKEMME